MSKPCYIASLCKFGWVDGNNTAIKGQFPTFIWKKTDLHSLRESECSAWKGFAAKLKYLTLGYEK